MSSVHKQTDLSYAELNSPMIQEDDLFPNDSIKGESSHKKHKINVSEFATGGGLKPYTQQS